MRFPGIPNPFNDVRRLGNYIWRDPVEDQAYSGMGLHDFLTDTVKGMNPIAQGQDIWKYRPQALGGTPYKGSQQMIFPWGGRGGKPRPKHTWDEEVPEAAAWPAPHKKRDYIDAKVAQNRIPFVVNEEGKFIVGNVGDMHYQIPHYDDFIRSMDMPGQNQGHFMNHPEYGEVVSKPWSTSVPQAGVARAAALAKRRWMEHKQGQRFNPERQKVLDAVAKVKSPPKKKPTQLDADIRKLRLEAEMGHGRQVTNRDIGHRLTPVSRPLPPRPPRAPQLSLAQQQLQLSNEIRAARRGGR